MMREKLGLSLGNFLLCGLLVTPAIALAEPETIIAQRENIPAQVRKAYTLLQQGLVNDAIAAFQQALKTYPQSLEAKLGLAIAYRRAGKDEEAWNAYQQVLQQDPNNQLALRTIGELGAYRPEWQSRGIEALTTLLNQNTNDLAARSQRALLYAYQGRLAEAKADYDIVLANNPTLDDVISAAQVYAYTGDSQRSLELFDRYVATGKKLKGNEAIAYARALRESQNYPLAIEVLEKQLKETDLTGEQKAQIRGELALAYVEAGQADKAESTLAPLRGSSDRTTQLTLARTYNEISRRTKDQRLAQEAARLYLQVLGQTSNPNPEFLREVADVLSGIPGQEQASLDIYRQLNALQPNNRARQIQQLALENQLGLISPLELKSRLRIALQPLPTDANEQKQLAQALTRIDPPDLEFLPVYETLIAANVNEPFLYFRVAQILLEQNNLVGATNALVQYQSTPEGANDQSPQLLYAEIERRQGNLVASAQRYEAIIANNPADSPIFQTALRSLAGIRETQGLNQEALALYDQLVALNPSDLKLQLAQAKVAYQVGRISATEGNAILERWLVTESENNNPAELLNLVAILPAMPQREGLYQRLLQINPNNTGIQLRLVQVIAARNPLEAKIRVRGLIQQNPNNIGAYFVQGELGRVLKDYELASQSYLQILQFDPYNVDAIGALAGIRAIQERFAEAQDLYIQYLAFKPNDFNIRRTLGTLMARQDQPLEALNILEQLAKELKQQGITDPELALEIRKIRETFLQRRGFQPSWEDYGF